MQIDKRMCEWKNYEDSIRLDRIVAMSLVFFGPPCIIPKNGHLGGGLKFIVCSDYWLRCIQLVIKCQLVSYLEDWWLWRFSKPKGRFSKPKVVDIWYLKAYSRASQRWDWPTPSLLSPVACSMMESCRVDDTSPERAVTGLSPGWVDPDVDWLYISINRPQPAGTRASTRSPITGRSERRRNDPMVILFKVRTCHMPE